MVGRHNHPGGFSWNSKVVYVENNLVVSLLLLRCRLENYDAFKDLPRDDVAFAQKIVYKVADDEVFPHVMCIVSFLCSFALTRITSRSKEDVSKRFVRSERS